MFNYLNNNTYLYILIILLLVHNGNTKGLIEKFLNWEYLTPILLGLILINQEKGRTTLNTPHGFNGCVCK